jgi:hypothetical protein
MDKINISILKDFSKTPGVRYPSEGNFSGQEFRDDILIPKVEQAIKENKHLVIDLDGTDGLGPSFLEEAFGGLVRKGYSADTLLSIMEFKSDEIPYYIDDIKRYISEAHEEK